MRIENNHPMRNGGWWYPNRERTVTIHPELPTKYRIGRASPTPDFNALITRWKSESAGELEAFAATLGVKWKDLIDLDVCWAKEYKALAIPMSNPDGEFIGIRLRNDFHKWSVRGSRNGLFIPWGAIKQLPLDTVLICEGPTDAAAGLSLGFFTIGRPSNLTGNEMIVELLRQLPVKEVIVAYDNDEHLDSMGKRIRPGPFGAERLIKSLRRPVTRFVPPTKDLRSFLTSGGSRALLLSLTACTIRS